MPTDLSTIDLATINATQGVIVAALRDQCCQWEQESADAAADGRLSNALMLEHWSFAANLLASKVGSEFTALFAQTLDAQLNRGKSARSIQDQLLDAMTLEVAAEQSEPVEVLSA
jgi:hypothetical protein